MKKIVRLFGWYTCNGKCFIPKEDSIVPQNPAHSMVKNKGVNAKFESSINDKYANFSISHELIVKHLILFIKY